MLTNFKNFVKFANFNERILTNFKTCSHPRILNLWRQPKSAVTANKLQGCERSIWNDLQTSKILAFLT